MRVLAYPGLGAKELAPKPAMAPARAKLLASLTSTADRLPSLAEIKKGLQATSRADTGDLDEIDGRAYQNLKELCAAARAYHHAANNPKRAGEYNLDFLHRAAARAGSSKPAATTGPARTSS